MNDLYVDPNRRGGGVGRALIDGPRRRPRAGAPPRMADGAGQPTAQRLTTRPGPKLDLVADELEA